MARSPRWALVLGLATGCVAQHRIVVTGDAIAREAATLRASGSASVEATEEVIDGPSYRRREVLRLDQTLVFDGEGHPVRALVTGCPGDGCPLAPLANFPIEVRRFESRNVGRALGATAYGLGAGLVVGAVACGLACQDDSTPKQASEITLGVAGVAIVGGLIWLLISCANGGCHD